MAFKLAELFVTLGLRDGGLKSGLNTAKRSIGESLAGIGGAFGLQLGLAGAVFGAGLVIKIASDAEEIQSKFEAVFKEMTADAEEFSKEFAKSVGRSVIDTKRSLSEFQDVLVPIGFNRTEALALSETLLTLSTDLASFNNKSDEQAADAVRKALLGEREMMKELGVTIDDADVKLGLLQKGQKGLKGDTLRQAKALVTLDIITRKSSDAMGDAIKTSKGFANRLKATQGAAKDLAAVVGSVFLPSLADTLGSITDVLRSMEDKFIDMIPAIEVWANTWADAVNFVQKAMDSLGVSQNTMERGLVKSFFDNLGVGIELFEKDAALLMANIGSEIMLGAAPRAEFTRTLRIWVAELKSELEQARPAIKQFMNEARVANRERFRAGQAGRGDLPTRGGTGGAAKPLSGFFGFSDLSKKIQEQTLKQQKPQEKMAGLMAADKVVQAQMLQVNRQIAANTAPGAGQPNVAVATPSP